MAEPTAKKTTAKKSSATKTAKKTPAKKTTKKAPETSADTSSQAPSNSAKTSSRRSASKQSTKKSAPARSSSSSGDRGASARAEAPPDRDRRASGGSTRVANAARQAVLELTGKRPEAVTGLERTDEGWTLELEVLELERIPRTTDVMAVYEVKLGDDDEVEGCRRLRRYVRGSADG